MGSKPILRLKGGFLVVMSWSFPFSSARCRRRKGGAKILTLIFAPYATQPSRPRGERDKGNSLLRGFVIINPQAVFVFDRHRRNNVFVSGYTWVIGPGERQWRKGFRSVWFIAVCNMTTLSAFSFYSLDYADTGNVELVSNLQSQIVNENFSRNWRSIRE